MTVGDDPLPDRPITSAPGCRHVRASTVVSRPPKPSSSILDRIVGWGGRGDKGNSEREAGFVKREAFRGSGWTGPAAFLWST